MAEEAREQVMQKAYESMEVIKAMADLPWMQPVRYRCTTGRVWNAR